MSNKRLIVFDLDGTLALSKTNVSANMSIALWELMKRYNVAVISGASFNQFLTQFVSGASFPSHLENLYLLPTCGSALYLYYEYYGEWRAWCEDVLSDVEKEEIMATFKHVIPMLSYELGTSFGPRIEDRNCQITFSALGQNAPLEEKAKWDPTTIKRQELKTLLDKHFNNKYEVRIGGATSVDVTQKGIDKAYGLNRLKTFLGIADEDILFIGDALFAGGNDYPVKAMGIDCINVNGPEETMEIIQALLGDD
jgi:HAD superfamily hydrolase (TIGR01484 family)